MVIGLYDAAFIKYENVIPNLDLMKIGKYRSIRGDVVSAASDFIPNTFKKFYYAKDYFDGEYDDLTKYDNITVRGRLFNEPYVPLDERLELLTPDITPFKRFGLYYGTQPGQLKAWDKITNAYHCRLTLNDTTLWDKGYEKICQELPKYKNDVIFHDYNLGQVKDIRSILKDLQKIGNKDSIHPFAFGVKYPVKVDTLDKLQEWYGLSSIGLLFCISYDGLIDDNQLLLKITNDNKYSRSFKYNPASSCTSDDFWKFQAPKIFEQAIELKNARVQIPLIYERLGEYDKTIYSFLMGVKAFTNPSVEFIKTYFEFTKTLKDNPMYLIRVPAVTIRREDYINVFKTVQEKNYDLFKMFYEYSAK